MRNSSRIPRGSTGRERGSAMIMVIVWSAVLLAVTAGLASTVTGLVKPSDRSDKSFAALAAAEAGLDDYRARLLKDNRYFLRSPAELASNTALSAWAPMPGGNGVGEFTYAVDSSRAFVAGELRVTSTGRVGGVTRTVEATLTKRSTLDYVYISDLETMAPLFPGAYASVTDAKTVCEGRRWATTGVIAPTGGTTGTHRNSEYCRWAGIYNTERFVGRVHTNDVWYLANNLKDVKPTAGDLTATFNGKVTTSCPPRATGSTTGCPAGHRWIDTSDVSSLQSPYGYSNANSYVTNELPTPGTGATVKQWNPEYDDVLEIPASNSRMKELAVDSGCVFTGPTRIKFLANGTMQVTSPATKSTRNYCGGTSLLASVSTPAVQPTVTLTIADMVKLGFNGVVYVQGTSSVDTDAANLWTSNTNPACLTKTAPSNKYPYVIPSLESSISPFSSGYAGKKGFPSEQIDSSQQSTYDCNAGDAFIQGEYKGAITVATANDIGLTGSTLDANDQNKSNPAYAWTGLEVDRPKIYGMPPVDSNNMLGLVPTRFLYAYRPLRDANSGSGVDWQYTQDIVASSLTDVIYNFAAVVLSQCFGSQDATKGPLSGSIYMRGSLGQRYRCPVGTTGSSGTGYAKNYQYDIRFTVEDPPPYMLELSNEPWKIKAYSETSTRRDPVATADLPALPPSGQTWSQQINTKHLYDLSSYIPAGYTLVDARLRSGSASAVAVENGKVAVTTDAFTGTTVVEYVVRKPPPADYLAAQTMSIKVS